jgi:hypothetical protein
MLWVSTEPHGDISRAPHSEPNRDRSGGHGLNMLGPLLQAAAITMGMLHFHG